MMSSNPPPFLIMCYEDRRVAVFRKDCLLYERAIATAKRNFRSLREVSEHEFVLKAEVPGHPEVGVVEISKDIWNVVITNANLVTIALESDIDGFGRFTPELPQDNPLERGIRKPVIYLYPPSSLSHVTVQLSLASSWSFSAVYPPPETTVNPEGYRSLTWSVAAEPDGTLADKTTGVEVSYLYWEAVVNSHLITPDNSRASTPVGDTETFDPSRPSVSPENSILLSIGQVPGYLDATLKALTLHTEARTSFITYWLPDLLKHKYVALRFLAQESYEQAAPMLVSPTPDVVTRVFMLFRGVAAADVELWEEAGGLGPAVATADSATSWAQVVGVDAARASDRGLFRVLEWGGMEVK